jgi:hypothetical protein
MSGIIFNSVTAFVEQVGRRLQWKYAELDNLLCTYIGPSASALQFKPPINSAHPSYPLMFVTDSSITNKEAGVAEVAVTYAGIIQTKGASSYVTPPITTESPTQGSRDFVNLFITPTGFAGLVFGPGGLGAQYEQIYSVTTRNATVRYLGRQCSVRYQSYPRPSGLKYSSLGISRVKWTVLSVTYGASSTVTAAVTGANAQQVISLNYGQLTGQLPQQTGVPPLYAANLGVEIEQRGQWYNCVETYGPTF